VQTFHHHELWAVVVGGGSGSRMSSELGLDAASALPKQFMKIGGRPVVVHTLSRFLEFDSRLRVVLVLPEAYVGRVGQLVLDHLSAEQRVRVAAVAGGSTRTESVRRGLAAIGPSADGLVAIQDAVRPFVTHEMISASYALAAERGSAICCVPSKASLRQTTEGGQSVAVDRSQYLAVQTPQTFQLALLRDAYTRALGDFTDDASLVESLGHAIYTCPGRYDNLKITTAEDLILAELLLKGITPADYV
jgi:2-C-methyl-D-erythritol 4-phosphate cytidylyltransferase